MEATEGGNLPLAKEELERALYCDPQFSPVYGGLAILHAYQGAGAADPEVARTEREKAFTHIREAAKKVRSDEDSFELSLARIRVEMLLEGKGWLKRAEKSYSLALGLTVNEANLLYYGDSGSLDYFMGLSYLQAQEFQKARGMFTRVLKGKKEGRWTAQADWAWKKSDRIVRAMAGIILGDAGRRIAVRETVTRADLSVLLVDELRIEKLFADRNPPLSPASNQTLIPADIMASPVKNSILAVVKWGIRGLEPAYDPSSRAYLFKPEQRVKRGEMAFVIEDLLSRLSGDERLASRYLGHEKSPFTDIRPTSPYYNAVLTVTTKGIMESDPSGAFRAESPVDGADAILALRMLKEQMKLR
jgi:hypothetical protein